MYSANELGFTCANIGGITGGYDIIKQAYETDLYLTTPLVLRVEYSCNGAPWTLLSEFNLNLSGYRENYAESQIFVTVEQTGARQQLANNYELQVNYFATQDVSGNPYARPTEALQTVHLPPLSYWTQNLLGLYEDEIYGLVCDGAGVTAYSPVVYQTRFLPLDNELVDEPDNFAYTANSWVTVGPTASGPSIVTTKGTYNLEVASFQASAPGYDTYIYEIRMRTQVGTGWADTTTVWSGSQILAIGQIFTFDYDFSQLFASVPYPGTINVQIGVNAKLTALIGPTPVEFLAQVAFAWNDPDTYLEVIEQNQIDLPNGVDLPATLINEAFSVPVELVSSQTMQMQSRILGRTDSYPFTQAQNGAWSIVAILSGLMLRRFPEKSENVGYDPYTYSIKELFEAVRAFFPVGWGFLGDLMVIEAIPYFYQDDIAITIEAGERAGDMQIELDRERTWNRARIGVSDWKIDGYNALEEFNTIISYATNWQSVNNAYDATGKIFTQQSRIVEQRLRDYRENPGDANDSTDFYALWIDRTTINDPIKEVLQGLISGSKIKDISSVINFSFNPSETMHRYNALYLNNFARWQGGEGNTEAQGATNNVGQIQAVSYPESTIFYDNTYSEPYSPITMNQDWGAGTYRKYQKLRIKGYISASDFGGFLANPYRRIQVNVGGDTFAGWVDTLTYEPNSSTCELELIFF